MMRKMEKKKKMRLGRMLGKKEPLLLSENERAMEKRLFLMKRSDPGWGESETGTRTRPLSARHPTMSENIKFTNIYLQDVIFDITHFADHHH